MGITLRNITGSALTYNQMDENFRFLSQSYFYLSGSNTGSASFSGSLTILGTTIFSGSTTVDTSVGNFIVTDNILGDPIFIVSSATMGMVGTSSFTGPTSFIGTTRITGSTNISGSTTITGSLNVSGSITGSLFGTASYAANANSSSYAATASYSTTLIAGASNSDVGVLRFSNSANSTIVTINNLTASLAATASSVTPLNQNVVITGSLTISGSNAFTNIGNARFVGNTTFSGSVSISGSNTLIGTNTITGSFNVSGSTTQTGDNTLIGNTILSGSITVSGSQLFRGTQTLSGSFLISGSTTQTGNNTLFGNNLITGSNTITGSNFLVGTNNLIGITTITGSFVVSGSGNNQLIGNTDVTGSLSVIGNINVVSGSAFTRWGNKLFSYISAYHTASILPTQNVSGSFIYSTVATSNDITITNNSRITFANTGIYNIQFSAQVFTQTGANVYIWLKRNGTNVADSAGRIGPTSNNEYVIAAWNYIDTFTSGSYAEIAYQSDQTNTQFQYIAATGNIPAITPIIVTVTQVA